MVKKCYKIIHLHTHFLSLPLSLPPRFLKYSSDFYVDLYFTIQPMSVSEEYEIISLSQTKHVSALSVQKRYVKLRGFKHHSEFGSASTPSPAGSHSNNNNNNKRRTVPRFGYITFVRVYVRSHY